MGQNTNISNKHSASHGTKTVPISSLEDLERALGTGTYTVTEDTHIVCSEDMTIPGVFSSAGFNLIFECTSQNINVTFSTTGALVTITGGTADFRLLRGNYILSGAGVQMVDLDVATYLTERVRITFTGGGANWVGNIKAASVMQNINTIMIGMSDGWDADVNILTMHIALFQSTLATANTMFRFSNIGLQAAISSIVTLIGPGESGWYFDPTITTPIELLSTPNNLNLGKYFEIGVSGTFTVIDDLTNANSVDSVGAGSTGSNFTTAGVHGYKVGDIIAHTTFSDSDYNGTFTIDEIVSTTVYRIAAITFNATGTGLGTVDEIRVTSATHGLSNGESLYLENAVYYGGHVIHGVLTSSFDVYTKYLGDATGTWSTGSLTNKSINVFTFNDGKLADSKTNAYMHALDQSAITTDLTQNVISRINAVFTEQDEERMHASSDGNVYSRSSNDLTLAVNGSITGTLSSGTNITANFYIAKGNIGVVVDSIADAGGGQLLVTTNIVHGYSNGDRIIIEDTTDYNSEYTIGSVTSTTYEITETYVSVQSGSNYKVLLYTKGNNDFSNQNKNTTVVTQIPVAQDDILFPCVVNLGNTADWETSDIQLTFSKIG